MKEECLNCPHRVPTLGEVNDRINQMNKEIWDAEKQIESEDKNVT